MSGDGWSPPIFYADMVRVQLYISYISADTTVLGKSWRIQQANNGEAEACQMYVNKDYRGSPNCAYVLYITLTRMYWLLT